MQRLEFVIDAGHGSDQRAGQSTPSGVRGPMGTLEKDVTLRIARRIASRFGAGAALTRSSDTNLTLAQRSDIARRSGARLFLSVHANEGRPGERGPEAWVHERGSAPSGALAQAILDELSRLPDAPPDRGVRFGNLAVLTPERLASDTAACLLEVDFLSDPAGERRLRDPRVADAIGDAIARGAEVFLGRAPGYGQKGPCDCGQSGGYYRGAPAASYALQDAEPCHYLYNDKYLMTMQLSNRIWEYRNEPLRRILKVVEPEFASGSSGGRAVYAWKNPAYETDPVSWLEIEWNRSNNSVTWDGVVDGVRVSSDGRHLYLFSCTINSQQQAELSKLDAVLLVTPGN